MAIAPSPPPPPVDTTPGSPWLEKWFYDIWQWVRTLAGLFVDLDFTGSNITSILTRNHYDLQSLQGGSGSGASAELYHLTQLAAARAEEIKTLGSALQVIRVNGAATALEYATLAGGGVPWDTTIRTSNFTATAAKAYALDSTSAAIVVTLPPSPVIGDVVALLDGYQTFRTNNVTIVGNGAKLCGQAADIVLQENGQYAAFVYLDATRGWELFDASVLDNYAVSSAGAPTTTDVLNGQDVVWYDTSGGSVKHYFNNGGTLVSVTMT